MPKYNGHPSYNAWNVSLWVFNDEGLYNLARECLKPYHTRDEAAHAFLNALREARIRETPDGVRYTFNTVRPCFSRDNWS
jgi:hypothetical protein